MSDMLTVRIRRRQVVEAPRPAPRGLTRVTPEQRADDAQLDSLRGELVRALDRLAAEDYGSSASFRRI